MPLPLRCVDIGDLDGLEPFADRFEGLGDELPCLVRLMLLVGDSCAERLTEACGVPRGRDAGGEDRSSASQSSESESSQGSAMMM